MEFETGVTRDGTSGRAQGAARARQGRVLRRGRVPRADGGDARVRPVRDRQRRTSRRTSNYTNNQPSGSVRAPTAPQVCWGLEQHMDEVAAAIGMDPVELRRRTLIEEGAEGPTRQVLRARSACSDTLETRGRDDRLRRASCPTTRRSASPSAGGRACRRRPARTCRLNGDGSATIVTGAQENGSGAVMAMPVFVGRGARHRSERRLDPVPGHRRRALGHGLVRLADDVQQRPGRSSPRRSEVREQLLDAAGRAARGRPRRPRARRRRRAREGLARPVGRDRRPRRRDRHRPREGLGRVPDGADRRHAAAASDGSATRRSSRPQLITQAAHVKVDRATGVVRVLQVAAAHDSGTDPEPGRAPTARCYGGVVMGVGLALSGGHDARRPRAGSGTRTCSTTSCVTCSDAPEIDVAWVEYDSGRAARLEGRRRAAAGPDGRGDRERDLEGDRRGTCASCR